MTARSIESSKGRAPQEKEEDSQEKSLRSKKSWISFVVIAFVLILLFFLVIVLPLYLNKVEFEDDKYNGFEFYKGSDGFWTTVIEKGDQPYYVPFYFHPRELEDIPIEPDLRNKFFNIRDNNGSIFITLDPDSASNKIVIAGTEIAKITGPGYGILNVQTKAAFIKAPSAASTNSETPIVTCNQASNRTLVIWLTLSDKNVVYSYDDCIVVEAKDYNDTVKVADRLAYHLLGIMLD